MTSCFSTIIYDINKDYMMQFVSSDSQTMLDDETVDSVRLIKTNKEFYVKLITLFLKFKEGNSDKFAC